MSSLNIEYALMSSGISIGAYSLYKIINHYRLHSTCVNNSLIISVEDTEKKDIEKPTIQKEDIALSQLHSHTHATP